jgi:GTP-binding protein YchF
MKVALVGRPGGGKTTLFNAISPKQVPLLPGVPGAAPFVSVVQVRDERLEWLRDLFRPKKYTPAAITVEDHPGIPSGSAKVDRRGELFGQMRQSDGLAVVLRGFTTGSYAYDEPAADPARDLELIALELLSSDLDVCERRLEKLATEWKKPTERDRVERERAVVERLAGALREGRGAHAVELRSEEEALVKGFLLFTRKPAVLVVNLAEGAAAPPLPPSSLDVRHRFDACLKLEADLAGLEGDDRALFAEEFGITEPLRDRFNLACYRGLGLLSFFTVGEDEVRAWTVETGDDAVTAAGKIHSDLAKGFIRAEVTPYGDLRTLGSVRDVKAKGKQRLEGRDYVVADGDILNIRFSV